MKVSRIEVLETSAPVFDLTVADNHNFFIKPHGSETPVLVSNCHQLTPQAQEALLKPMEEPPADTVWIVCTTNPEKLRDTLINRCTPLVLKYVEPEVIARRLAKIAEAEGHDLSDASGQKLIQHISENCNGQVRNAITALSSALNVLSSGKKITDIESFIDKYVRDENSDLEQLACNLLAGLLKKDLDIVLKSARSTDQPRGLISKVRWLIEYLLELGYGKPRYTPASAKLFAKQRIIPMKDVDTKDLCLIQFALCKIESEMNLLNIDEKIIFQSYLVKLV